MKIQVFFDLHSFYWCAVDYDTYDGAPDSHVGHGINGKEAIKDLLTILKIDHENAEIEVMI